MFGRQVGDETRAARGPTAQVPSTDERRQGGGTSRPGVGDIVD